MSVVEVPSLQSFALVKLFDFGVELYSLEDQRIIKHFCNLFERYQTARYLLKLKCVYREKCLSGAECVTGDVYQPSKLFDDVLNNRIKVLRVFHTLDPSVSLRKQFQTIIGSYRFTNCIKYSNDCGDSSEPSQRRLRIHHKFSTIRSPLLLFSRKNVCHSIFLSSSEEEDE